jgi:anthranilate phosphoribosyltransferase
MDEITLTGSTLVAVIADGKVELQTIEPEQFGLQRCQLADLQGGDAERNAEIVRSILAGEPGPKRDVVVLNGAYALVAAGQAGSVRDGIEKIRIALDEGFALAKLEKLVEVSNA